KFENFATIIGDQKEILVRRPSRAHCVVVFVRAIQPVCRMSHRRIPPILRQYESGKRRGQSIASQKYAITTNIVSRIVGIRTWIGVEYPILIGGHQIYIRHIMSVLVATFRGIIKTSKRISSPIAITAPEDIKHSIGGRKSERRGVRDR